MKNDVVKPCAWFVMAFLLSVPLLNANDNLAGNYLISKPYIPATPPGSQVAAGYLQLTNNGGQMDRLISIKVPFAKKAEIHEITMDGDVAKMRKLDAPLVLQPGATVSLEPGSLHLMFMGITSSLVPGESQPVTLRFEKAGERVIDFEVTDSRKKHSAQKHMVEPENADEQTRDNTGATIHQMHKDDSLMDSGADKDPSKQPLKTVN